MKLCTFCDEEITKGERNLDFEGAPIHEMCLNHIQDVANCLNEKVPLTHRVGQTPFVVFVKPIGKRLCIIT